VFECWLTSKSTFALKRPVAHHQSGEIDTLAVVVMARIARVIGCCHHGQFFLFFSSNNHKDTHFLNKSE